MRVAEQVERDVHWQPKKRSEVRAEREQRRHAPPRERAIQPVTGEDEPPTFDEFLMQHQLIAREQALAWAEKVGWTIVAGMVLGPDLATVWVDELNEARRQRVLPVMDAQQEAEYRQVFVRMLEDKRPQ